MHEFVLIWVLKPTVSVPQACLPCLQQFLRLGVKFIAPKPGIQYLSMTQDHTARITTGRIYSSEIITGLQKVQICSTEVYSTNMKGNFIEINFVLVYHK